jgi:hypothetical protein
VLEQEREEGEEFEKTMMKSVIPEMPDTSKDAEVGEEVTNHSVKQPSLTLNSRNLILHSRNCLVEIVRYQLEQPSS